MYTWKPELLDLKDYPPHTILRWQFNGPKCKCKMHLGLYQIIEVPFTSWPLLTLCQALCMNISLNLKIIL